MDRFARDLDVARGGFVLWFAAGLGLFAAACLVVGVAVVLDRVGGWF